MESSRSNTSMSKTSNHDLAFIGDSIYIRENFTDSIRKPDYIKTNTTTTPKNIEAYTEYVNNANKNHSFKLVLINKEEADKDKDYKGNRNNKYISKENNIASTQDTNNNTTKKIAVKEKILIRYMNSSMITEDNSNNNNAKIENSAYNRTNLNTNLDIYKSNIIDDKEKRKIELSKRLEAKSEKVHCACTIF